MYRFNVPASMLGWSKLCKAKILLARDLLLVNTKYGQLAALPLPNRPCRTQAHPHLCWSSCSAGTRPPLPPARRPRPPRPPSSQWADTQGQEGQGHLPRNQPSQQRWCYSRVMAKQLPLSILSWLSQAADPNSLLSSFPAIQRAEF